MEVTGYIVDYISGEPLPGATVRITDYTSGNVTGQVITNDNGYFKMLAGPYEFLYITHVGYAPLLIATTDAVMMGTIGLDKSDSTLPEVIVTPGNKNTLWLLLLLALAITIMLSKKKQRKKSVGSPALAVAAGSLLQDKWVRLIVMGIVVYVILQVSGLFKSILQLLGLKTKPETEKLDNAATDPGSFWNPKFWESGPSGTLILTAAAVENYAKQIWDAIGAFNDDEEAVKAVFRKMKTQSQASYLADHFASKYKSDLLAFLRGGYWPQDRLSDYDVNEITEFVNRLPKYKL